MLRFFKKLRSQNLSKGSIRKYVLYVLGELLLIVTGIVIAVQINNLNNNRKLRDSEQLYLQRLLTDVKSDLDRFNFLDSMTNKSLNTTNQVLEALGQTLTREEKLEVINIGFLNFYALNPNTATYQEMVNTGRMYSTANQQLRSRIIYYYNNLEKDHNYFEYGNSRVKDYMDRETMSDYWLIKRKLRSELQVSNRDFPWLSNQSSEEWKSFETTTYVYQTSLKKNKVRLEILRSSAEGLIKSIQEDLK